MANRTTFFRPPLALIANAERWLNEALESILEPQGYRVVSASNGKELVQRAPGARADVVVLNANLPDVDSIETCRALRDTRVVARGVPIIMITSTPTTKQQRLAALRAGAWDYLSLPLDAEELVLKLETYAHVKLEVDRAVEENPVDQASGLYNPRGLDRRARELVSDAFRRRAPLACVALSVEPESADTASAAPAAFTTAIDYVAQLLHARGRTSDAIGRLGGSEFAVLAPATRADGAVKLAHRLAQTIETSRLRPEGLPALLVRAGYEALADVHATPIEPQSLLEHASAALEQARTSGSGERVFGYQAGPI
ncbi:MAG: response regulator [Gemmatimonadales bacterium]